MALLAVSKTPVELHIPHSCRVFLFEGKMEVFGPDCPTSVLMHVHCISSKSNTLQEWGHGHNLVLGGVIVVCKPLTHCMTASECCVWHGMTMWVQSRICQRH